MPEEQIQNNFAKRILSGLPAITESEYNTAAHDIRKRNIIKANERLRKTSEIAYIRDPETGEGHYVSNPGAGFMSGTDPIGELFVSSVAIGKPLLLLGKGVKVGNGLKTVGNAALQTGYKVVPKVGRAFDMAFPGTNAWWLLYNTGKYGKYLANGLALGEAAGLTAATNNMIDNPSLENGINLGLSVLPWVGGTVKGVKSVGNNIKDAYKTISDAATVTNKSTILNRLRHPVLSTEYGKIISNYRKALGEEMFKVAKPHLSEVKLYTKGEMPAYMPKQMGKSPYIQGLSKKVLGDDMWTIAHEAAHAWDEGVGALYHSYDGGGLYRGPYFHNLKVPDEYKYATEAIDDLSLLSPRQIENEFTADVLASEFYKPKYTDPGDGSNIYLNRYSLAKRTKDPVYNTSGPVYSRDFKALLAQEDEYSQSLDKQYKDLFKKWVHETNNELPYNVFQTRPDIKALNQKRQLLNTRFYERAKGINPKAYYSVGSNGELQLRLWTDNLRGTVDGLINDLLLGISKPSKVETPVIKSDNSVSLDIPIVKSKYINKPGRINKEIEYVNISPDDYWQYLETGILPNKNKGLKRNFGASRRGPTYDDNFDGSWDNIISTLEDFKSGGKLNYTKYFN